MKCRITGNRLCLLSNRKCPYYYLFSSPNSCPEWYRSEYPKKEQCVFGDGPGRYKHPRTQQCYCSISCFKRIEDEYERKCLRVEIPKSESTIIKSNMEPDVSSQQLPSSQQVSAELDPVPTQSNQSSTKFSQSPSKLNPPLSSKLPQSSIKPTQSKSSIQSPSKVSSQSSSMQQRMTSRPMIVTSTTPDGQTLQYQLNHARSILVNANSVNIPISPNQVYYLQIDYSGQTVATPHIMCGTTVKNGCLFYCMVPMILMSNNSAKYVCLF